MIGAVALLLLVACANVAGLLLTHGVSRNRELAVRAAIGATRLRIVRQLLTESLVLASVGAAGGVALAWVAQPLVAALRPADLLTWKPIAVDAFYRALLDGVRAIPGVRAAGTVHALPLSGNSSVRPYRLQEGPPPGTATVAHYRIVSPGYLEAMRIPLRAGRTFTDADTADHPLVVIVNETLKREAWNGRNPVGSRITFGGLPDRWAEVVGVVGDVRHFGPGTPPSPEMYWPAAQVAAVPSDTLRRLRRQTTLVVSVAAGDPLSAVPAVRSVVRGIDPDQPIAHVETMSSLLNQSLWLSRAAMWLLSIFGGTALLFALLGVAGAAAYAVAQRQRELAVRLALGAAPGTIARAVLNGAVRGALAGVVVGIALAFALRQSVAALLVGVEPTDPRTLAVVSLSLVACAAAASWLPARRAGRIDPMRLLRVE